MNIINEKSSSKFIFKMFFVILPAILLTFLFSCEEDPSSLGADLLPDSDKIQILYDTTISFTSYVKEGDTLFTRNFSTFNIGINNNADFGTVSGGIASQFLPINYVNAFKNILSIDSLVLYLKIDSIYGEFNGNTNFDVYELDSALHADYMYYSNYQITNLIPNNNKINTDSRVIGDSLLAFSLNSTFLSKLISDTIFYANKDTFLFNFNGISVIPQENNVDGGQLFKINVGTTESRIGLFYKTIKDTVIDTLNFNYYFSGTRFGKYTNDHTGSFASQFLNDDSDSLIFLQGMNGLSSSIVFNNIDAWKNESKYSILDAELIIPVYNQPGDYAYPNNLYLTYTDNDGNHQQIEDSFTKIFGGEYNNNKNEYSFKISKHLKNLLNGELTDSSLDIRIVNNSSPHRVILKSNNNIKLKVTYTKY